MVFIGNLSTISERTVPKNRLVVGYEELSLVYQEEKKPDGC